MFSRATSAGLCARPPRSVGEGYLRFTPPPGAAFRGEAPVRIISRTATTSKWISRSRDAPLGRRSSHACASMYRPNLAWQRATATVSLGSGAAGSKLRSRRKISRASSTRPSRSRLFAPHAKSVGASGRFRESARSLPPNRDSVCRPLPRRRLTRQSRTRASLERRKLRFPANLEPTLRSSSSRLFSSSRRPSYSNATART